MNSQKPFQAPPSSDVTAIKFVGVENFREQLNELSQVIAARAYEKYERRGRADGHALEDWCCAEREIGRLVPVGIFEHPDQMEINVRLLGCLSQEIEACLEPHRLFVRARKGAENSQTSSADNETKRHFNCLFLALTLPKQIDPNKATARFENGDLFLTLPKVLAH
ncbi:MAG TPA: DUF2934 domain-containing protein [Pyrinomonadaceae bacterium]|nr:DUF2934 domain-containing protein [Pyrinomonadaceae bacterium]